MALENKECTISPESLDMILQRWPEAMAAVRGSMKYPEINGVVRFYQTSCGVIVAAEIMGLPDTENVCRKPVFGFHIHEGSQCSGTMQQPFANAGGHYNPHGCEHPYHAGDLPPLFGNNGYALMVFLTNRFSVSEVIGRVVLIHEHADDFMTQPSGNSGEMIACGEIRIVRR